MNYTKFKTEKELRILYEELDQLKKDYDKFKQKVVKKRLKKDLVDQLNKIIDYKEANGLDCLEDKEILKELINQIDVKL